MIFVGDDWAEDHDVYLMGESGERLVPRPPRGTTPAFVSCTN